MPQPAHATSALPAPRRAPRAALIAAAAAGTGVLVAVGGARHALGRPLALDRRLRDASLGPRLASAARARAQGRSHTTTRAVSDAFGLLTGQWATTLGGLAAAVALARRRGLVAALPALAAVPLTNAAHAAVKYTLREPRPLYARLTGKHTPSFPSGHAARGAALAGLLAHLASRERVAPAGPVLALGAAVALAGGMNRFWVERHWASDLIGGWALGAATAAGIALLDDAVASRGPSRG